MGLTDFHATAFHKKSTHRPMGCSEEELRAQGTKVRHAAGKRIGQAINFTGGAARPGAERHGHDVRHPDNCATTASRAKASPSRWSKTTTWFPATGTTSSASSISASTAAPSSRSNPAPPSGPTNCFDPDTVFNYQEDDGETLLDAEWATAIAPGAHVEVASCSMPRRVSMPRPTTFSAACFSRRTTHQSAPAVPTSSAPAMATASTSRTRPARRPSI